MTEIILKNIIGILLTILLNIIIDYFILKEGSDLFTFIKEIPKRKSTLYMYILSVIIQLVLINIQEVNLVCYLYYLVTLIFYKIAVIDYKTKYVDNKLFIILILVSFMSLGIDNGVSMIEGLLTGVITFLLLWLFSKATRGALGMGDVKVLGALGVIFGFQGLMGIMIVGSAIVFVISIVLIIKSRANSKKELAFTPYLFLSLLLILVINNI